MIKKTKMINGNEILFILEDDFGSYIIIGCQGHTESEPTVIYNHDDAIRIAQKWGYRIESQYMET